MNLSRLCLFPGVLLAVFVSAAGAQDAYTVADFARMDAALSARPWPRDKDGRPTTAKISAERAESEGGFALRVEYEFPSANCTQVMLDFPVRTGKCFSRTTFRVRGDKSGNVLEVWMNGAGRWTGQGKLPLDFDGWREIKLPVTKMDADVVNALRFCIVQKGGLGRHILFLDNVRLIEPATPMFTDLHVFAEPPQALCEGAPATKKFQLARRSLDDRTILLLDGETLFAVLDAHFEPSYLEAARSAGVNCFAIDLYWRAIEPRPGYREWPRLRKMIECLQRRGLGVILMLGAHQPNWWIAQHGDEPGAEKGQAYPFSTALQRDFGNYVAEFVRQTSDLPNVIAYMVSAGGEQDTSFPEVLGDPAGASAWRQSPACLRDFRGFLRGKCRDESALRLAWQDAAATFETAVPPQRLTEDDYRRPWLDWCEFANAWWVSFADWAGKIVKDNTAPSRAASPCLFQVRFGWPVFQAENVFLVGNSQYTDLVQCKDAVASWEVGHPGYQLYRTALYLGACKHTDKIVFPEMDIIHNRGYSPADMRRYMPLFSEMAGALWYYRGLSPQNAASMEDFKQAVEAARQTIASEHPRAKVGIFYSLAYANWISLHRNYANEQALVGCTELLRDLGLRFALVSEFNLPDLADYDTVIIPYNPAISETAARALDEFVARGGAVIMEPEAGGYDYENGKRQREAGTLPLAGVKVAAEDRARKKLTVRLEGLGPAKEISCFADMTQRIEPGGQVIGRYDDGSPAVALGKGKNRTLYLAFRFFSPYSFSDEPMTKAAKRELLQAFLNRD
jgi:beta-galactosidase GanA